MFAGLRDEDAAAVTLMPEFVREPDLVGNLALVVRSQPLQKVVLGGIMRGIALE